MSHHPSDHEMKTDEIYSPSPQQSLPLKVFISDKLLNAPTGQCFGKWLPTRNIAIVTAIGDSRDVSHQEVIPFMYWKNVSQQVSMKEIATGLLSQHMRVIFEQRSFNGLPLCHSRECVNDVSCHADLKEDVILIVFHEEDVKGHKLIGGGGGHSNYSGWTNSDIEIVSDLLKQSERKVLPGKVLRVLYQTLTLLLFVLLWPIITTLRVFLYGCAAVDQIFSLAPVWVRHLLLLPMVTCHLTSKIRILKCLMRTEGKREKNSDVERLRFGNRLLVLLVDLFLGCLVCYLFQSYSFHTIISHHLVELLQSTSFQLQELLRWLMGAPAGLKLNSGFAHFLGNFFLYQSYLWIGYLHILYPVLDNIIWVMSISGCLGLTVLLSAASDILSLLTFHIYCFYVYAAKMFTLQLSALISLSRLFRGRKWNVLRNRVDSCRYDVDQLVVGTLIFTVLLFLLPTSLLFYSVFTGLQIVVLVIRGTITSIIYHISTFPWFTAIKWLLKNAVFRDRISFIFLKRDQGGVTYLVLKLQMMSLMKAIHLSREVRRDDQNQPSWIDLIKNILQGRIIYKWKKLNRS